MPHFSTRGLPRLFFLPLSVCVCVVVHSVLKGATMPSDAPSATDFVQDYAAKRAAQLERAKRIREERLQQQQQRQQQKPQQQQQPYSGDGASGTTSTANTSNNNALMWQQQQQQQQQQ
ncbi:hypothetical protein DQ04_24261000, partial [Trypanosoma grayi]|uniref:hypothetical protein n=1 Tax=Trypanosoma grayi TaxID=71804 RepID=UPI0004F42E9B